MDLTIDPGSPYVRTAIERSPTSLEWAQLRKYIAYAYKKKQHTARMILHDLKGRGFVVTDKVLRSRIKKWGVDDKNKRKAKPSSKSHVEVNNAVGPVVSNGLLPSNHHDPGTEESRSIARRIHPNSQLENVESSDEILLFPNSSAWKSVPRAFNCNQQLQTNRVVTAMAHWHDYLASETSQITMSDFQRAAMLEFFNTLGAGLDLVRHNAPAGRNILEKTGFEIPAVLRSSDPALAVMLLRNLIGWQDEGRWNVRYKAYALVVVECVQRIAGIELGIHHPITLLVEIFARETTPSDLCNMLCKAIEHNYVCRLDNDGLAPVKVYFRRCFGDMLLCQGRFLDIEGWYDKYVAERVFLKPTPIEDAHALHMLGHSRLRRDLYAKAEGALFQALRCLEIADQQYTRFACGILSLYGRCKYTMRDFQASEKVFQRCLSIAEARTHEDRRAQAIIDLYILYERSGRMDLVAQLSQRYPDILTDTSA